MPPLKPDLSDELEFVKSLVVRGNYPHKRTILSRMQRFIMGQAQDLPPGYKNPVVEAYDNKGRLLKEYQVRDIDIPFLTQVDQKSAIDYLDLFLKAEAQFPGTRGILTDLIQEFVHDNKKYLKNLPRKGDEYVVPCTCDDEYSEQLISNKGATLLELSRTGHPVPDFAVLTSAVYSQTAKKRMKHLEHAIYLLERLTALQVGSSRRPLVFALRCAMPCYMPGVMPTFLNVGITENTVAALVHIYGQEAAYKMALNNLRNLLAVVDPAGHRQLFTGGSENEHLLELQVDGGFNLVRQQDARLVEDPIYQAAFFIAQAFKYFDSNRDLMLTFSRGEEHFPSLILQRMVCTVRSDKSRVGVIHSRHPRTGKGMQIESAQNIFGEEIMAGTVETEKTNFGDEAEIKDAFPAVYRYMHTLRQLEKSLGSPVTIEFATDITQRHEFFNLLQLNASEITGRSAIISIMDLYRNGFIQQKRVTELIRPYHIKQIESDAIDPGSFKELSLFSKGASVLPRSAVSAQVYFSAESALTQKKQGNKVCLCKKTFDPSDTVVMGEMDAIISLTSAAIHVVTICQSYGLPALLNLKKEGVSLLETGILVNSSGDMIKEGDWVTVSSRNRCLFRGKARFKPARLIRYMKGEQVDLEAHEIDAFEQMSKAYNEYNQLITTLKSDQILSLAEIIRLVVLEFRGETEKAKDLVNFWFDNHSDLYIDGVFKSEMGDHLNQHTAFNLLTLNRRIAFFKLALEKCRIEKKSGYSAGMFMLGRFISMPQPVEFWKSFSPLEISLLVNEWLLFEKYMHILHEVGERRIRRAKQKILESSLGMLELAPHKVKTLITLKLSQISLTEVRHELPEWTDVQSRDLIEILLQPYANFFAYDDPWSRGQLEKICQKEKLPVPPPDSV
jgi:hypothetical protein